MKLLHRREEENNFSIGWRRYVLLTSLVGNQEEIILFFFTKDNVDDRDFKLIKSITIELSAFAYQFIKSSGTANEPTTRRGMCLCMRIIRT